MLVPISSQSPIAACSHQTLLALPLLLHAQPMPRPDPRQGSGRIGHSIPYGCSLQNIAEQKDCAIELQEYTKKTFLRPYSDLTWGV